MIKLRNYSLIALYSLLLFPVYSSAECSREDINWYLKKGFSHEQVVKLCGESDSVGQDAGKQPVKSLQTKPQQKSHKTRPTMDSESSEPETFLKIAIQASEVFITDETLQYVKKTCIEYGIEDFNGFRNAACPLVSFSIQRDGMGVETTDTRNFFIFPSQQITVSGTIERRIQDLEQYPEKTRRKLLRALETGPETVIPIRKEIPLYRAEQAIRELIN